MAKERDKDSGERLDDSSNGSIARQRKGYQQAKRRLPKKENRKKKKREKEKKKKKNWKCDDSSTSVPQSQSSLERDDRHRKKRRKEKDRKRNDAKRRRRQNDEESVDSYSHRHHSSWNDNDSDNTSSLTERNRAIVSSLYSLLSRHPALATELPIMLIRLAGGASFDLSNMTDENASEGLSCFFSSLDSLGIKRVEGKWIWASSNGSSSNNELLLIRVIRTILDENGFTMSAVSEYETRLSPDLPNSYTENNQATDLDVVERMASELLCVFGVDKLRCELEGLVELILQGDCISLAGRLDSVLHERLEQLFVECGLILQEMEASDGDCKMEVNVTDHADGSSDGYVRVEGAATLGYALPDHGEALCRAKLATILRVCHDGPVSSKKSSNAIGMASNMSHCVRRSYHGPLMNPEAYQQNVDAKNSTALVEDSSSEEEGPVQRGVTVRNLKNCQMSTDVSLSRGGTCNLESEYLLSGTNAQSKNIVQREEWMLVPGKFDFWGGIKTGKSMKGREFERSGQRSRVDAVEKAAIDPAVEAELERIIRAHENSRGPSLMDVYRRKKAEEATVTAGTRPRGAKTASRWNRERDLESGQRVDKNALSMIFGGAATELRTKFHGGIR